MLTILVVDDSVVERRLAGSLLQRHLACDVLYAADGHEALQKIADDLSRQRDKFVTNAATEAAAKAAEAKAAISGNPGIAGFAQDGGIYIDQGQNAGITVGRRFRVMHVVDVIKDAKGNELDKITKPIAVIEVTQVLARSSVCKVVSGTKPDAKDLLEPQ